MAIEDIDRLKEKLDKDPHSKLFVPLAEEYKKEGMLDEAIEVLTKGLEGQPTYLSARVSLGKIYIERGMLDEAETEFKKVITVIPDNLYAHKKLAEIYKDLGKTDDAIREFKTVLRLNPTDEWAAAGLSSIEQGPVVQPEGPLAKEPEETSYPGEEAAEMSPLQEGPFEPGQKMPFDDSLTARDLEISKILSEESKGEPEQEEEPSEIPFSRTDTDLWSATPEPTEEIKEGQEIPPQRTISKEDMELWKTHIEEVAEIDTESADEVEPAVEAEELPDEGPISFEDILKEPEAAVQETIVKEQAVPPQQVSGQSADDADKWILQGEYGEAMNIYRTVLSAEPDNKRVLQRIEELRTLLKLLGKDKDELITRLDRLLQGIKKRRDEFSGSA